MVSTYESSALKQTKSKLSFYSPSHKKNTQNNFKVKIYGVFVFIELFRSLCNLLDVGFFSLSTQFSATEIRHNCSRLSSKFKIFHVFNSRTIIQIFQKQNFLLIAHLTSTLFRHWLAHLLNRCFDSCAREITCIEKAEEKKNGESRKENEQSFFFVWLRRRRCVQEWAEKSRNVIDESEIFECICVESSKKVPLWSRSTVPSQDVPCVVVFTLISSVHRCIAWGEIFAIISIARASPALAESRPMLSLMNFFGVYISVCRLWR